MSLGEKIAAIMQRPGQDPVAKDDVPWWMKYGGRGLGTIGGILFIFIGVWNCTFILIGSVNSLLCGMWMMVAGFTVIMIEAPCCCMFIDFVQNLSDWVENRPYWNRAVGYILIAVPPIFISFGMSTLFGSIMIFMTGVIYGLMAIGKKAPLDEMRTSAIDTQVRTSSMQSTLVENAQPMSITSTPDSNL